ncbi:MAG TPA: DoxX family protein [Nitrospira sp.]|nr:DoxX family protein [Nitrospira sp.]
MNDKAYVSLIGRLLIGLIFVMSGIHKIADPQGTQQYMAAMGITTGTTFLYAGAVFMEVAGGLSLWLGVWSKWGATALIIFMMPTTLIFHTNFGDLFEEPRNDGWTAVCGRLRARTIEHRSRSFTGESGCRV